MKVRLLSSDPIDAKLLLQPLGYNTNVILNVDVVRPIDVVDRFENLPVQVINGDSTVGCRLLQGSYDQARCRVGRVNPEGGVVHFYSGRLCFSHWSNFSDRNSEEQSKSDQHERTHRVQRTSGT